MGKAIKTIALIAVAVFAPYVAASLGLTGFAATAFSFMLQTAANFLLQDKPKRGGAGGVQDSGFMLNKQGNNHQLPVVYGERRIGGTRVYLESTDSSGDKTAGDEFLHLVIAFAHGGTRSDGTDNIDSVDKIYFNNTEIYDFNTTTWTEDVAQGFTGDDSYENNTTIKIWYGANDQTVASPDRTVGSFNLSTEWTSNHRMRGVAYAYVICKYNRDRFPGAPTVFFDVKGKRIQAVNNLGSFTNNATEMSNPANILYDYLTNERYGKGIAAADIDATSFEDARTWANGSAGVILDCAIDTTDTLFNNTQKILSCSNMNLVYTNGKYTVKPVKEESFSGAFTFTTANIIGQWTISLGNKRNRFNKLTANFFNPDLDWQPDSVVVENATYLSEDSGVLNEKTVDLPLIGDKTLAEKLCTYYLNQSRYQTIVQFKATHEALKLSVGDPVYITHEVPDWTNQKFRVNSITLQPDSTVDVVLEEYAPDSIYLENN